MYFCYVPREFIEQPSVYKLSIQCYTLDMLYSRLFGRTVRDVPGDAKLASHKLLYKAGYIRDLVSGRYSLLPLGERVEKKIIKIIEEEMDGIGAQRITTPTFHPIELWSKSGRIKTMSDVLTRVKDKRGAEFALGATHEEVFVDLVEKFAPSEKDLPIILYQFSNKFRDETRARGGLIRVREFVMKDAYSFHADAKSLDSVYEDFYKAYVRIFERLGINAVPIEADSGAIGGKVSHEFMAPCVDGEDSYLVCKQCGYASNQEKAEVSWVMEKSEEEFPIEEVAAPNLITIEQAAKYYGTQLSKQLKTVVFRVPVEGKKDEYEFVGIVLRGDAEVNEIKVARLLDLHDLTAATKEELEAMGLDRGFIGPVENSMVKFYGDYSIQSVKNFYTGANKKDVYYKNVNYPRDFSTIDLGDFTKAKDGSRCVKCGGEYRLEHGIEVGHVFRLDYFYSEPMDANFTATDGSKKKLLMGCYGIGVERNLATIVEQNNDDRGIVWPKSVAPFDLHLISLNADDKAKAVYEELKRSGFEVLYDDRSVSAGVKFSDYELIGIPIRLVVSTKTGEKIEYKERLKDEKILLDLGELLSSLRSV